jgi:hypothetical protein
VAELLTALFGIDPEHSACNEYVECLITETYICISSSTLTA